jgi:Zn-dependent M28 family amino/carboxypeptidase
LTPFRFVSVLLACAVTTAALADTASIPAPVMEVAKTQITRSALEAPIRFLASDALEGRGPATRGDELARLYLASELEQLGYAPGGPEGKWEQPFDIVGIRTHAPKSWSFRGKSGSTVDLAWYEDYIGASGVQEPTTSIENAEVVFVGYGIEAPEYQWNDYKGMNLQGKVLLMLNNDPEADPKLFAGKTRLYYGRWTYKYESAARQKAAGVIIIHTTPSAGYPWQVVQNSWSTEQFELPAEAEPRVQFKGWATEAASRKLVAAAGRNFDQLVKAAQSRNFKPVPLGITTSFASKNEVSRKKTANVAGVLEGSDPKLKQEMVVYTAHHDHLGIGEPNDKGDRIYNGAQDNAAGCAQVLAIARALAALPQRPKRSQLILFVAAEEQGLLGSLYYALHPTVPAGRLAANINYDGGNIYGRSRDVTQIGPGKSTMDAITASVVAMQGRKINPDNFPDRGYYYRSDQFSLAKVGVPALYLDTGLVFVGKPEGWGKQQVEEWEAKDYHQPSDELRDTWNFDGMIDDAQLGFYVGWLVSEAAAMPTWTPGDEFEAARKKALAHAGH